MNDSISRRSFLEAAAAAALVPAGAKAARAKQRSTRPPNILIILADDMGFSDVGCYGGEIRTPHINRLANDGLRFTQFYNAARCCPTRAALLTGLYPHQAGMGQMVSFPDAPKPEGPYQGYLNDRCVTIAEALKPAGYRTYMSGKWHVGEAPEHWPRQRGFDRYFGLISGGSSYWELLKEQEGRVRHMALDDTPYTPQPGKFYMTDAIADHAVACLHEHPKDEPFFHYLAFTSPHWPLHAWPEDIARYHGKYRVGWDALREARHARQRELGVVAPRWPLSPRDPDVPAWETVDPEEWDALMAVYAAMVDRMDQNIGRVLKVLDKRGLAENTLVLFLSDNGGCHEDVTGRKMNEPGKEPGERGSFVSYKKPWANLSNTPFRLFKHWTHEGGIATPLIAHWPGVIKPGALSKEVGHVIDLLPTCLDLAGVVYPEQYEGRSLRPVLEGGTREAHERLCWEHYGNRAIRQEHWKLVAPKDGPWELYDLEADRTELNNLIDHEPGRAQSMMSEYEKWAAKCGVQ